MPLNHNQLQNGHGRRRYISKVFLIIVAIILILLAASEIYHDFKPELYLLIHYNHANQAKLLHLIRSHSSRDMILLMIIIALMNAIPGVSNSVICIFSGLCYGPLIGWLINWTGDVLGNCLVAVLINRINFSAKYRHNRAMQRLANAKHPEIALTMGYMIPIIPSVLVNYTVVRMGTTRKRYLAMVGIGMIPTSFLYAFGGDAIIKGNIKRIVWALVIIAVIIIGYKVIDHINAQRQLRKNAKNA